MEIFEQEQEREVLMRVINAFIGIWLITCIVGCSNKITTVVETENNSKINRSKESVHILFAGDLLLDRGIRLQIKRNGGIDHLFSGVDSVIETHDYFVVNLETPLTDIESPLNKKYIFRSDGKHAKDLARLGVTHAVLSNNHSMDQGKIGLVDTYKRLSIANIEEIGFGINYDDFCKPGIIKKNNHTIALFGSIQIPVENWFQLDNQPGVCQKKGQELVDDIKTYRNTHPNHKIIVNLHWGMEYLSTPNFTQIEHAKNLIDAGADAIIGHHPHVIQSIQEYKGKMIYYSIGNFIFDSKHPNSKKAFLISVEIDSDGKVICKDILIHIKNCRPELI